MSLRLVPAVLAGALAVSAPSGARAQCVSLTASGSTYTQDFDTLANTGTSSVTPVGWFFAEAGANANAEYAAGTGSGTAGDTYSFGASGASDRAFGGLFSGSLTPTLGACFTNNMGLYLTSLAIAYTGEQWRLGTLGREDRLDFQFSTDATSLTTGTWTNVDALDFTAPVRTGTAGALDGNAAANRTAIADSVSGLLVPGGGTLWLRWSDFNATSSDDGLAVDDFTLTPQGADLRLVTINDVSALEGNTGTTTFNFTVLLNAPAPAGGVTFDVSTGDGTAVAAGDYASVSLAGVTIPAGGRSHTVPVQVVGDTTWEEDETFYVNITNVVNGIIQDGQGVGTIRNDDNDPPTITPFLDQSTEEDHEVGPLAFTIGDLETAPDDLLVTARSSDESVASAADIVLGGAGATRAITVVPVPNAHGVTTITVAVSDGVDESSESFLLTVTPVNDAPTISAIANQLIDEDGTTGPLAFTVADAETPVGDLLVSGNSDNHFIVPTHRIVFQGTGPQRTVTVSPMPDIYGSVTITLTVSDGTTSAVTSFIVDISPVNDPPVMSPILDQETGEGQQVGPISFEVRDSESEAMELQVSATSSNTAVLPQSGISLGGTGNQRTITLRPAVTGGGQSTVTVRVTDDEGAYTEASFRLTVTPVNQAPTISDVLDQEVPEDQSTGFIPFTVQDRETPADALVVTASSSNTVLVSASGIALGGTGEARSVRLTPNTNAAGTTTITLRVSDGSLQAQRSFVLTVVDVNDPPTITAMEDKETYEGQAAGPFSFTVGDAETPAGSLSVNASSSNLAVVPAAGIALGGVSGERTITLTPAAGASGATSITITVSDGMDQASVTFQLTVVPVNQAPTVSAILDQQVQEDVATDVLSFFISDRETPADALEVNAVSSDLGVVGPSGILLGGSGNQRTIRITPRPNAHGNADITVSVSDGTSQATTTFRVTVLEVNDRPVVTAIADQETDKNTPTAPLEFSIGDVETSVALLTVQATSSDLGVVDSTGVVLGGGGADRTIELHPVHDAVGVTTIKVSVSDGTDTTEMTFKLTVKQVVGSSSSAGVSSTSAPVSGTSSSTGTGSSSVVLVSSSAGVSSSAAAGSSSLGASSGPASSSTSVEESSSSLEAGSSSSLVEVSSSAESSSSSLVEVSSSAGDVSSSGEASSAVTSSSSSEAPSSAAEPSSSADVSSGEVSSSSFGETESSSAEPPSSAPASSGGDSSSAEASSAEASSGDPSSAEGSSSTAESGVSPASSGTLSSSSRGAVPGWGSSGQEYEEDGDGTTGCGCEVSSPGPAWAWLLVAVLVVGRAWRRRR